MNRKQNLLAFLLICTFYAKAQIREFNCFVSKDNDVSIDWFVEPYQSCEVIVEHSTDSTNFNEIYAYPGVCEGGQYGDRFSFKHSSPVLGMNYYRLNLGRYGRTQIRRVEITDAPNGLKLAPNPFNARTRVTVQNNGAFYDMIILDMKGNTIRKTEGMFFPEFWLERELLLEGIYYLILTDYRNFFTYKKIVVRDDY